ncbi:MAG TPA: extracellular solute-binding protein [Chthoniobacterales bacterium]|nr:extracellular solute-binding protein [Verrucomicrobiota bacterium]HTD15939.1 extracellular solute-binding protein [Chthoniobacterales bacterium]
MIARAVLSSLILTLALTPFAVSAEKLVINSNQSDPAPRETFTKVVDEFKKQNPDLQVEFNTMDHEGYKTAIRNWLTTEPPDVVFWFAGNRMKAFVDRGLLDDVSDLWQKNNYDQVFKSTLPAMTVDGKQYGIPTSYYQWGVYYRKDIFDKYGISVPKTWDEFVEAGKKLKQNGVTPVTIGTKFPWTAAGWFDYLNLRINGFDFHIQLMDGKVPYTDPRVKEVFAKWQQLIDAGFFLANNSNYSWQESVPFIMNGKAAMILIGNFFTQTISDDMKDKFGFFPFPVIKPDIADGEDAPVDTIHIPAKAKNKAGARKFLEFVAKPEIQEIIAAGTKTLPANLNAKALADPFLEAGAKLLAGAKAAQFYDRDTNPEMATEGMKGFQEFMVYPNRIDSILQRLDKIEARVFKEQAKEADVRAMDRLQGGIPSRRLVEQSTDTSLLKAR